MDWEEFVGWLDEPDETASYRMNYTGPMILKPKDVTHSHMPFSKSFDMDGTEALYHFYLTAHGNYLNRQEAATLSLDY